MRDEEYFALRMSGFRPPLPRAGGAPLSDLLTAIEGI